MKLLHMYSSSICGLMILSPSITHKTLCLYPYLQFSPSALCFSTGIVVSGLLGVLPDIQGGGGLNCVLACPLLEIPVIVFEADVDALSEVARVRNGPEEVGLDQCDVIELRGAGRTSLSTVWVQEHLRKTHTHVPRTQRKEKKKQRRDLISRRRRVYQLVGCALRGLFRCSIWAETQVT